MTNVGKFNTIKPVGPLLKFNHC